MSPRETGHHSNPEGCSREPISTAHYEVNSIHREESVRRQRLLTLRPGVGISQRAKRPSQRREGTQLHSDTGTNLHSKSPTSVVTHSTSVRSRIFGAIQGYEFTLATVRNADRASRPPGSWIAREKRFAAPMAARVRTACA